MIILDTNVLSALMTAPADAAVVAWLDRQARISMWTTSITVLEIRFGLATMADGRRRNAQAGQAAKGGDQCTGTDGQRRLPSQDHGISLLFGSQADAAVREACHLASADNPARRR